MKIFITGTAGFIGFNVAKALLENNHNVCGYDGITNYYDVKLKINRTKILEEMRTKTFDGRIGHKLQKELKSPLRRAGALRQMKGKWEKGWGGNVSNNALPQDGYGPVGWTRIESNEAYVDRLTGSLPSVGGRNFAEHASGSMDPSREEIGYDATNGRPAIKKKIKMQPRHAKSNPIFPKVDSVQNGLEFGLSVKKRRHVLKV